MAAGLRLLEGFPWIDEETPVTPMAAIRESGRAGSQRDLRVYYGPRRYNIDISLRTGELTAGWSVYAEGTPSCERGRWEEIRRNALEGLRAARGEQMITETEFARALPRVEKLLA
jgi:hypothetical protein